jgi:hypothetical protein
MYSINFPGKPCKLTVALIIRSIERVSIGGICVMGFYCNGPIVTGAGGVSAADDQGNTAIQRIGGAIDTAFLIDYGQSVIPGSKVTECGRGLPP